MQDPLATETGFLKELTQVIEKNISNEQFGVSGLADELNMSRSNLLRKVKKETKLSVSQLISQVRLKKAMDLLRKTSMNVSQVSEQVGFNSTSYFIKCFREYYGYPPGEVGKRPDAPIPGALPPDEKKPVFLRPLVVAGLALTVAAILLIAGLAWWSNDQPGEKSIVVLPFKNESNDSTNLYLINGLMEATLNNLQQIADLRVVSRTSAEKYRTSAKSVPEMAKELNVQYVVEGSGQKIGDRILLNIQLIEAATDRHLWARQYRRESTDIFALQQEIAKDIAKEIKVIITPEAARQIEKVPTNNLVAYDYFLKAKDIFYRSGRKDLEESVPLFEKAIEEDPEFALAYATLTQVYYYLDLFNIRKEFGEKINTYADKAMLFDPKSGESLVAKALSYAHKKEYSQSVPFFEKALEYNPGSGVVLHFLSEFYNLHVPNPRKYLEYAWMKVQVDAQSDSMTTAFNYFHLANAYFQNGFYDEAKKYITLSLSLNPKGYFSKYIEAYIDYARHRDLKLTRRDLEAELQKDTNRLDLQQEVAKLAYLTGDNASAYKYYKQFDGIRSMLQLDLYHQEDLRMAIVFQKAGDKAGYGQLLDSYKSYIETDKSMYRHFHLAAYYAHLGENEKAVEHMKMFAREDNFLFHVQLLKDEPVFAHLLDNPGFKTAVKTIEGKIAAAQERTKKDLEEKGLIKPL